jgi:hypothetical protein
VGELPEAPCISDAIKDIDHVVLVFGPALRHRRVVAGDEIADDCDVLVLPTDQ